MPVQLYLQRVRCLSTLRIMIGNIFSEYIVLTPLLVMVLAEITKHTYEGLSHGYWFKHGGFPSSHSAFVVSLMAVIGNKEGVDSAAFAIATVFACITWYDAAFVRSQVGRQAKALNVLQQFQEFSERIGHSVIEVIGGIVFGLLMTTIILWQV